MSKNYSHIAKLSLGIAAGLFAGSLPFRNSNLLGGIVHAASEAALVGGMADWYAVTALFRHPLHLSCIPHTAIIPKNRERIIEGIVDMVQNKWLTKEIIAEKLAKINLMNWIWPYLERKETQDYLAQMLVSFVQVGMKQMQEEERLAGLEMFLIEQGKKQNFPVLLQGIFRWVQEHGFEEQIFAFVYEESRKFLHSEKFGETLLTIIENTVSNFLESGKGGVMMQMIAPLLKNINFTEAAKTIQKNIVQMVDDEESLYREKFQAWLQSFDARLSDDVLLKNALEDWKNRFLAHLSLQPLLKRALDKLQHTSFLQEDHLTPLLTDLLAAEIDKYKADAEKVQVLNDWLKEQIFLFIQQRHALIGKLVQENLEKLSEDDFVVQIEDKVGQDLQWIRVNGAVVGGLVGIVLYLIKVILAQGGM